MGIQSYDAGPASESAKAAGEESKATDTIPLDTGTMVYHYHQSVTTDAEVMSAVLTTFGKLPIELRLIIWEMALPGRRNLTLYFLPRSPSRYLSE